MRKLFLYILTVFTIAIMPTASWAAGDNHGGAKPLIEIGNPDAHGQHIDSPSTQENATLHIVDDAHHGEKPDGLPQFDPSSFPSQVFWLAVIFIILYIFFSKKTLPEISKVIENRTEHVQTDLSGAASLKKEAEEVHDAYEAILEKARHTSMDSFAAVELAIKEQSDAASEDFRKRSAKDIEKTEKSVEKAKAKVLGEIDAVAAQVARDAAEKIIGVKSDLKQAESVVQSLQGKKKAA